MTGLRCTRDWAKGTPRVRSSRARTAADAAVSIKPESERNEERRIGFSIHRLLQQRFHAAPPPIGLKSEVFLPTTHKQHRHKLHRNGTPAAAQADPSMGRILAHCYYALNCEKRLYAVEFRRFTVQASGDERAIPEANPCSGIQVAIRSAKRDYIVLVCRTKF
jgi:hypothetical protein